MELRKKLQLLLDRNIPDMSKKKIWIWGAGNTAALYQEGLKRIKNEGFIIEGYIDRNASEMNNEFSGKKVKHPDNINDASNICVLICTIRPNVIKDIREECKQKQIENYLLDEVILSLHKAEVLECYDNLYDNKSRKIYYELTKARVTGEEITGDIIQPEQYFCLEPFKQKNKEEIFVDCGAYDGDSICEYIKKKNGVFKKIIAFEPDKKNFEKLKKTVERQCREWNIGKDRFELYPYAIGEKNSVVKFEHYENNDGISSKIVEMSSKEEADCNVISVDEFIEDSYDFLKADIESFEYKMLLGAEKSIKANKPLLAICIYHNAVDFYQIPLLLKEMVPDYNITIRHHREDTSETIVYAWV